MRYRHGTARRSTVTRLAPTVLRPWQSWLRTAAQLSQPNLGPTASDETLPVA